MQTLEVLGPTMSVEATWWCCDVLVHVRTSVDRDPSDTLLVVDITEDRWLDQNPFWVFFRFFCSFLLFDRRIPC